MGSRLKYKRVLLKLSGEALKNSDGHGISPQVISSIAEQIKEIADLGCNIAVVVGGGNIFRGVAASARGMDRATADYIGMLATVMNSIALQDAIEKLGLKTRVQSAIAMQEIAEPYVRRRAMRHLEKGRAVIFAGGTGNPFFSTDTAAALRALEIGAEIIVKATKVDGVYTADPVLDPQATRISRITYKEVLEKDLKFMDVTAASLCMENKLPTIVLSLKVSGNIRRALLGEEIGTLVEP